MHSTVSGFNLSPISTSLVKFLDSPDRRLLIADEVGLGKTIEAGVILTELQARHQNLERVLIVCPSRLRDKWREEMQRKFRQKFEIMGAQQLKEYCHRAQADPDDSPLRGIVSMQTLRRESMQI